MMVDSARDVLWAAYHIYEEIKGMNAEIIANKKSMSLLTSRFEGVATDVKDMVERGDVSDQKLVPARNFLRLCEDARDFLLQFSRNDHATGLAGKAFAWASKAYNRKGDKAALVEFLHRLDTCSADLNLRVTMDVKKDVAEIAILLQEDGDAMREMLGELLENQDGQARNMEAQFNAIKDAINELKLQQGGDLSSNSSVATTTSSNGSTTSGWCAMLPAVSEQYDYVSTDASHELVDDRDDASIGEGAFGEVFLTKGRFHKELYAIKLVKIKKVERAGVSTDAMRQEAANMRRLSHVNIIRMWAECQEDKGKLYGIVMEYAAGGPSRLMSKRREADPSRRPGSGPVSCAQACITCITSVACNTVT